MQPKAIPNLSMVRGTDGLLRLEMLAVGQEAVLDPLAELVWDLSDGSRNLEDLAQAAGRAFDRVVHKEEIFSALDFLADAGLLKERVAPPVAEGKVSRRSLLVRIAPVVGAAAWMMSGPYARAGGFLQYSESNTKESNTKESNNKESNNKANARESNTKEQNRKSDNRQQDKEDSDKRTDTDAINKERDVKDRLGNNEKSAGASSNREHNNKERDRVWYDQHKGRLDQTGKYAVVPNHPLLGKWRFVAEPGKTITLRDSHTAATLFWTFSSRGILETQVSSISYTSREQSNWKYTSTGARTGVLEGVLGELFERADIRWISRNEFEYTVTLSRNHPDVIGERFRFVRVN